MPPTACITGLGFATCLGNDSATVAESLRAGRSGIITHSLFDNPALSIKVAAPVKGFNVDSPNYRDWTWPAGIDLPRETVRGLAPHGVYAFHAFEQALADARLVPADLRDGATGLFCASAGSAFLLHHNLAQARASPPPHPCTHVARPSPARSARTRACFAGTS